MTSATSLVTALRRLAIVAWLLAAEVRDVVAAAFAPESVGLWLRRNRMVER